MVLFVGIALGGGIQDRDVLVVAKRGRELAHPERHEAEFQALFRDTARGKDQENLSDLLLVQAGEGHLSATSGSGTEKSLRSNDGGVPAL